MSLQQKRRRSSSSPTPCGEPTIADIIISGEHLNNPVCKEISRFLSRRKIPNEKEGGRSRRGEESAICANWRVIDAGLTPYSCPGRREKDYRTALYPLSSSPYFQLLWILIERRWAERINSARYRNREIENWDRSSLYIYIFREKRRERKKDGAQRQLACKKKKKRKERERRRAKKWNNAVDYSWFGECSMRLWPRLGLAYLA